MRTNPITIAPTLIARFWQKVDQSSSPHGCWLWTHAKRHHGYGLINRGTNGRNVSAHRLSYHIHFGEIPEGLLVLHNCPGGDNPACVNPAHLFLGTSSDNTHDMDKKGRAHRHIFPKGDQHWAHLNKGKMPRGDNHPARLHPERLARGEQSGNAKLTETIVLQIRSDYANGTATRQEMAKHFGVSWTNVNSIVKHKIWRHVN